MQPRCLAIIPARHGSTRFPGKPLADLNGVPLIAHVVRAAQSSASTTQVAVATDDARIAAAAARAGATPVLTDTSLPSGTARVAAAARALLRGGESECATVVNVQGDEPLVCPGHIDAAVALVRGGEGADVGTVVTRVRAEAELHDENVVKCVRGRGGRAVYFSRAAVPFVAGRTVMEGVHLRHVGIYAFRAGVLVEKVAGLGRVGLAAVEDLEQLAWLEDGLDVRVAEVEWAHRGVDVPGDLERVRGVFERDGAEMGGVGRC